MKRFNRYYVRRLIDEGVTMVYGKPRQLLKMKETIGIWHPDTNLIIIRPNLEQKLENVTLVHEWLHAYEDMILERERCRETQIDWWAYYFCRKDKLLPEYIRSFFRKEGF